MKVQGTSIIGTLRCMAASSLWIPAFSNSLWLGQPMTFHPTSTLLNLQTAPPCFRSIIPNTLEFSSAMATTNSVRRWSVEARTVCSAAGNHFVKAKESPGAKDARTIHSGNTTSVVKGISERSHDERSRENANHPPPQVVPWKKELFNTVHFIGTIDSPVQFRRTQSGKASASTTLGVKANTKGEIMRLKLVFWNELAETAAQHLKENDTVYVSGFLGLQTTPGQSANLQRYQVIAKTLNFTKASSPDFSRQVVVSDYKAPHVDSPYFSQEAVVSGYETSHVKSPDFSQQAVVSDYKSDYVKSSSSSRNALKDAAFVESLWQEYFSNPLEWWDNRTNKTNPGFPDFKHKGTGECLWIECSSNPPWVKSQLPVLDYRRKVLEDWGKDRSHARFQGSFSSS